MAYLAEYGLFFAKVLTLFLMIMGVLVSLIGIAMRNRHAPAEQIEVRRINDRYREMADALETATLAPALGLIVLPGGGKEVAMAEFPGKL